ncbi:PH domain-containing protein [Longispora urticae]
MNMVLMAVRYEWGIWKSLFRWVLRRPVAPAGEQPFGYAQAVAPVMWVFIVLSAIEIPAFHMLIPWKTVQGIGLVFGAWGLFWMIGLLAALKTSPHTLGPDGIRVRNGFGVGVFIPWAQVAAVRPGRRTLERSRTIQADGDTLSLVVLSQTNVDIVLREPATLRRMRGETAPFTELRVFADDAAGFVARARELQPSAAS